MDLYIYLSWYQSIYLSIYPSIFAQVSLLVECTFTSKDHESIIFSQQISDESISSWGDIYIFGTGSYFSRTSIFQLFSVGSKKEQKWLDPKKLRLGFFLAPWNFRFRIRIVFFGNPGVFSLVRFRFLIFHLNLVIPGRSSGNLWLVILQFLRRILWILARGLT